MSITRGELIELALGADEARKVDTAIPQSVFDTMSETSRDDIAGWYYAPEAKYGGRLLTQTECHSLIKARIERWQVVAIMMDTDISHIAVKWACLRQHVERGEIQLCTSEEYTGRRCTDRGGK